MLQDADGETPLHKAAAAGHTHAVACLLQAFPKAQVAVDKHGLTPLDRATGAAATALMHAAGVGD